MMKYTDLYPHQSFFGGCIICDAVRLCCVILTGVSIILANPLISIREQINKRSTVLCNVPLKSITHPSLQYFS